MKRKASDLFGNKVLGISYLTGLIVGIGATVAGIVYVRKRKKKPVVESETDNL